MPTADGSGATTQQTETQAEPRTGLGTQEEFVTPTHNIGCVFTPEGGTATYMPAGGGPELSCDRVEPVYARATLGRSGPPEIDRNVTGEASCCSANPVLEYGDVWRRGPFTCASARTGLTCTRDDGHSMFISRRRISGN
ncbi:hypothetical protein ADU59_12420 [Pararhizobium polonicum]|uniref:Uncharacterized protein n=2 Tax=Pararhizobium polonicum TaxID=1612624 RepID=A0A1C7P732_9HYPH|nr:hypothetical protein ADU59_12420 [Pararhizobium polonicum]